MPNNGNSLSFAASEAYKLLRTNILFSFTDEKKCYAIGITSSIRGEGKTTTSINLARTFADAGKKVLVVDGDLRIPKIAKRFGVNRTPGLSNVLVGANSKDSVLEISSIQENLYVLASGNIPPNPSELLSSPKMAMIMDSLKEKFEIIILDLPPVDVVSDALVVSPLLDGIVFVVREDYTNKRAVNSAIRALEFANARILGFVTTCADAPSSKYGYKKYGSKYGYKYGYKYKYAYTDGYQHQYDEQRAKIDE